MFLFCYNLIPASFVFCGFFFFVRFVIYFLYFFNIKRCLSSFIRPSECLWVCVCSLSVIFGSSLYVMLSVVIIWDW